MSDINKVWLSGVVVSDPVYTKLSTTKTPLTYFNLQVNESFRNRAGVAQVKPNVIRIECLGKAAETSSRKVKRGKRYTVDGYIRQDHHEEQELFRVRSFAVYPDESLDEINYKEALKQALRIVKSSRDIDSAIDRLEEMIL